MEYQTAVTATAFVLPCFASTWQEVQPALLRRARRLCRGDYHQAEELLADTAIKAYQYLQHNPERVQDLQGFLFMVLKHIFLDHVRRLQRERKLFEPLDDDDAPELLQASSPSPTPEQQLQLQQRLQCVDRARERLTPPQQHLFQLRFELELPYPQIASTLNISEPLARKRVELLRKKLQTGLSER